MQQQAQQPEPAVDWWWLGSGAVFVVTPAAALVTRWDSVRASHPAYGIVLGVATALGLLLVWAGASGKARPRARGRLVTRVALISLSVIVAALVWIMRPLAATEIAVAAMADGPQVSVTQSSTRISLDPIDAAQPVELIFYPGGFVDPRAYAHILRPLAAAGYPVTIIKPPLGLAILAGGFDPASDEDQATVVGGHSLGGVAASRDVADHTEITGLLLWAAFPADSIAHRTDLTAMSISGSEDALTTPSDVAQSISELPPATVFVEIAGAVHSQFGDYGDQRGDGTPTISREEAQAQIVAATLQHLDALARQLTR